jgi:hypothetical protein
VEQRRGRGAAERRAAAAAERRAATAAERRAATAAERSSAGTDNGLWLTVANGGLSALACDGEESAAASSSGELQAAAAASGERQQQRRAALCKLAHQALKQTSIRSHHQRLCSRPEHSCGNDHCKTSATQMRGRLAATFYGCAEGR